VTKSGLIKAQNTPQFNWYTWWTSLGANGMPDKLIKEGLKQPDQIKVSSFEKGTKEITGHVTSNQAWFSAEYFLAYTLPDFKSKILTWLSDLQKDNGPLLFSLLYEGKLQWVHQGLPWGRCRVPQHWQPADSLALYGKEARSHVNARVHAASSAASQLPQDWLPPLNDGRTHGAREEWTNLLRAA
jgi:hypothetical protein